MPILPNSFIRSWRLQSNTQRLLFLACLGLLLLGTGLLGLCWGSRSYSLPQLWQLINSADVTSPGYRILLHVRLPRVLAASLAGMSLAASGVLLQAVLNNAMASPNIIGVNAGAGLAVLVTGVVFPSAAFMGPAAAFAGGLLAALLVYFLALRAGLSRTSLVLAGLALSGILTACINGVKFLYPDLSTGINTYLMGTLSGVTLKGVLFALPYIVLGLSLAFVLAADIDILCLGDEGAGALGLNVGRTRFLAILAAALLAGAAVSFAGLLSFVGLLVPHMARYFVGSNHRWLLPAAAVLGASFVQLCDLAARTWFVPFEFPVGILLSLLGGPFFLSLLLSHQRGRFQ